MPELNVRSYILLFGIENAIRELIVEELSGLFGPRWYKQRLPGDILRKYADAVKLQRLTRWTNLIPHHPIYYIDFPDLKKLIERQDNWDDSFSRIFARKELISATLSELEPIRNSLAHNRKVGEGDIHLVEGCVAKIVSAVGTERFSRLASISSTAGSISQELASLQLETEACASCCATFQPLDDLKAWTGIQNQWWFDETYLGFPTEPIERCFELLTEYASLPRRRGQGYVIEEWVNSSGVCEAGKVASETLRKLIETSK